MPGPGSPAGFGGAYDDPAAKEFQQETGADPNVGRFYTEYSALSFTNNSVASGASIAVHHTLTGVALNGRHS